MTRTAAKILVGQLVIGGLSSYLLGGEWFHYMMSVVISALIGAITIQARAKEAGDAKLRLAQEEVERLAKLAERERIARDMHDLLGHTLSVVVLKSELAQKLMSRDPAQGHAGDGGGRTHLPARASLKCARRSPAIDRRDSLPRSSMCARP